MKLAHLRDDLGARGEVARARLRVGQQPALPRRRHLRFLRVEELSPLTLGGCGRFLRRRRRAGSGLVRREGSALVVGHGRGDERGLQALLQRGGGVAAHLEAEAVELLEAPDDRALH